MSMLFVAWNNKCDDMRLSSTSSMRIHVGLPLGTVLFLAGECRELVVARVLTHTCLVALVAAGETPAAATRRSRQFARCARSRPRVLLMVVAVFILGAGRL